MSHGEEHGMMSTIFIILPYFRRFRRRSYYPRRRFYRRNSFYRQQNSALLSQQNRELRLREQREAQNQKEMLQQLYDLEMSRLMQKAQNRELKLRIKQADVEEPVEVPSVNQFQNLTREDLIALIMNTSNVQTVQEQDD